LATAAVLTSARHDQPALGNGFGIVLGTYDGAAVSAYYGGSATGSANNQSTSGPIDYTAMTVDVAIGVRSRYLPVEGLVGSIAEIFMYDHALPAAERDALDLYFSDRYGL